jgi:hypothetical protein
MKEKDKVTMKKPKIKVGDTVDVTFIGQLYKSCTVIEVRKHPIKDRWILKVITTDGVKIPYVGIDGSEEHANIKTK